MNPVQNAPIPLFELADATPNGGGGGLAGSAADASVALTSPRSFGDAVRPTWWPRNPGPGPAPQPDPDDNQGGLPGLIDKLVDRLDAIVERLGRLLGRGETPQDEDGTAVRFPWFDTKQAAGGSPSPASCLPAESCSGIDFAQMERYSPADFTQMERYSPADCTQLERYSPADVAQMRSPSLLERLQV